MKMTTAWLESRQEARNRAEKRYDATVDGRKGLMVRVFPSGAVSFRLRYTLNGARCVMVFGEFGRDGLSLDDAFDLHHTAMRELKAGLDPIEERAKRQEADRRARDELAGAGTVSDLVAQFYHRKLRAERWDGERWVRDSRAKTKTRKRPEVAAALLGYTSASPPRRRPPSRKKAVPSLISALGKVRARDLTKRELIDFLDGIVDRGSPVTANRTYSLLKQMFNWAAAKDLIPASPMAGIEKPGGDEQPRSRALSADELRSFWVKLDGTANMAEPTRLALKLLLVTAQRRGEITGAKWSHFDFDRKVWTIPVELLKSSHSKSARPEPHVVPLSPLAMNLLSKLKEHTGEGIYVLPAHASNRHSAPYSPGVLTRAIRKNYRHFGIERFTPHDLRRTAASFMTRLKVPRLHVEKVLNHATGDIAEVYDRHDYAPEKRAALDKWGRHISAIIDGSDSKVMERPRG